MTQKSSLPLSAGLDIGSSRVRCVIGLQEADSPSPSIIGVGEAPTTGVRRGVIVDIEETVSAVTAAVDEAERIAGSHINHATVGVNGTHLLTVASHGIVAIGSSNREISDQDVARVEEAATVMQLPPNREIIQAFARNYMIDGQEHIQDPVGMSGTRLEVDSCLITAGTPFIKNLARCVHQAGIEINHLAANPLAAAGALVSKRHKELGCILLDIGSMTTGMAVFEEGELLHVAVVPIGSAHISNDLAVGLRTDIDTAEKLKLEHVDGAPGTRPAKHEPITVKELNGDELTLSQTEMDSVAHARLDELFELVNDELKKLKRENMLPGGAILCGGGANLKHIADYAKQALRLPSQVAHPEGFSGIVDKINNPAYATAVGLMLEDALAGTRGSSSLDSITRGGKSLLKKVIRRVRRQS